VSDLLLSVVVPVYNEAGAVRASLERLRAVPQRMEVICVDDASTDGSSEILAEMHREGVIDQLVTHPRNRGKGAAVRRDSSGRRRRGGHPRRDLEYDPFELPRLLEPIADGRADAVFGSRFLGARAGCSTSGTAWGTGW
jgi:glycosyltransferase involved in cell wall biosynthesis